MMAAAAAAPSGGPRDEGCGRSAPRRPRRRAAGADGQAAGRIARGHLRGPEPHPAPGAPALGRAAPAQGRAGPVLLREAGPAPRGAPPAPLTRHGPAPATAAARRTPSSDASRAGGAGPLRGERARPGPAPGTAAAGTPVRVDPAARLRGGARPRPPAPSALARGRGRLRGGVVGIEPGRRAPGPSGRVRSRSEPDLPARAPRTQSSGRQGARMISLNFAAKGRPRHSSSVSSRALVRSLAKTSSRCRATPSSKISALIS